MSFTCTSCGRTSNAKSAFAGGICQGCYKYFRSGGTIHPIPKPGEIAKDDHGYVICHICGRSFVRLGSHVTQVHGLTIKDYKAQFGLCARSHTTEAYYAKHMRIAAIGNGMQEQLIEVGKGTRIRAGEKQMRLGKEVRLQEIKMKKDRYTHHG